MTNKAARAIRNARRPQLTARRGQASRKRPVRLQRGGRPSTAATSTEAQNLAKASDVQTETKALSAVELQKHESTYLPLLMGTQFGYTNLQYKARGGNGIVYSATHQGQTVAVKVSSRQSDVQQQKHLKIQALLREKTREPAFQQQFFCARHASPATPATPAPVPCTCVFAPSTLFDLHTDVDGVRILTVEHMDLFEMDLNSYAKSGEWSFRQLQAVFCQVLNGIRLAHEIDMVLSDLKLQNLMIDRAEGRVRFIDYSESITSASDPSSKRLRHSRTYYIVDEQYYGTPMEDVWRFGFMLLIFLTRRFGQRRPAAESTTREWTVKLHRLVRQHKVPYRDPEVQDMLARTLRSLHDDMCQMGSVAIGKEFKQKADSVLRLLQRTLHTDAPTRPTIEQLLTDPALCFACQRLCPRVDFSIFFRGPHRNQIKLIEEARREPSAAATATADAAAGYHSQRRRRCRRRRHASWRYSTRKNARTAKDRATRRTKQRAERREMRREMRRARRRADDARRA